MMNNCYCQSEDNEVRDVIVSNLEEQENAIYPEGKPWSVLTADNMVTFFKSEKSACSFQRHWRELMHLDPVTGEFIIEG